MCVCVTFISTLREEENNICVKVKRERKLKYAKIEKNK